MARELPIRYEGVAKTKLVLNSTLARWLLSEMQAEPVATTQIQEQCKLLT